MNLKVLRAHRSDGRGQCWTQNGTLQEVSSCTTQQPPGVVTHATPEEAASHSPGATHQPNVPHNVTFPRLPQQEHRKKGRQRQRRKGQGKGQQRGIRKKGKTRAQTSQCSKITRWKQRMKISVLRLHHQKVCSQKPGGKVSKGKKCA